MFEKSEESSPETPGKFKKKQIKIESSDESDQEEIVPNVHKSSSKIETSA